MTDEMNPTKEKRPEIRGLKKLRNFQEDGSRMPRRPEWNRPNRKAAANLKRRQDAHDKLVNDPKTDNYIVKCHHRPGSMKIP